MTIVVVVTALLNTTSLELATGKDADADRELRAIGMSNVIAGFFGGKTDMVLMRFVDVIYAFPTLLFVILLMSMFGRDRRRSVTGQANSRNSRIASSRSPLWSRSHTRRAYHGA